MEMDRAEINAITIFNPPRREPEIPERLIQVFLSENLNLLGISGLKLVGLEHQVDAGRIDILARCTDGIFCPIEVKRGTATRDAVGQLQSYVGNLLVEHPGTHVKGILVAADLDGAAKAALVATPTIDFWSYRANFSFTKVGIDRPKPSTAEVRKPPAQALRPPAGLPPRGGREATGSRYCVFCKKQTEGIVLAGGATKCSHCRNWL